MEFPDDDNGEVLRRMQSRGDKLSRERDVAFTVVFPDQSSAESFAKIYSNCGFQVSTELSETTEGFPWDVVIVKHMALFHQAITAFENELEKAADPLGGQNDGWGCFSKPPATHIN